eukprot:SAG22_NODE_3544_length_1651_cov_1.028351_1_plen_284_part_10
MKVFQPIGGNCPGMRRTDTLANYQFNGNAKDTTGTNHGIISGAVAFVSDRHGSSTAAVYFNGVDQFITVAAPFPNADIEFTISIWLKPTAVDTGWHGFVGYHSQLGDTMQCCCPHRSPSLWVGRKNVQTTDAYGQAVPQQLDEYGRPALMEQGGLHYDSCQKDGEGSTARVAGVVYADPQMNAIPPPPPGYPGPPPPRVPAGDEFFQANTYVHIVWVKQGANYVFYRNGVQVATKPAPAMVNMNQLYNIGHNDNYFVGVIDDVRFYDRGLNPQEATGLYTPLQE